MAIATPEPGLMRRLYRQVVRSLVAKQRNDAGVMVALYLPPDVAAELAVPGGEPVDALHLTLRIFAPDAAQVPQDKLDRWAAEIEQVAKRTPVLSGRVSGVGKFNGDQAGGEDVVYATIDLPGLEQLRDSIRWCGDYRERDDDDEPEHGFSPHVTLAYGDVEFPDVPTLPVRIDRLTFAVGTDRRDYLFAGADSVARPTAARKAEWSTAYVNDLPDSSFLHVEAGGEKDEDGRTTPRSLRHFPVKDAEGKVDLPHVRNALARIPQSNLGADVQATCERKARMMLEAATEKAVKRAEAVASALGALGWEGQVEVEPVGVTDDGAAIVWKADREEGPGIVLVDTGSEVLELSAWVERRDAPESLEPVSRFAVLKATDELRYTLGVAYPAKRTEKARDPKDVDAHHDYMTPEELERAAWAYLRERTVVKASGGTGVGTMHRDGTDGAGEVVESYIYRGPTWKVEDQVVEAGDWLLGVVWDEPTWARIQAGELTGYSMQGYAAREAD